MSDLKDPTKYLIDIFNHNEKNVNINPKDLNILEKLFTRAIFICRKAPWSIKSLEIPEPMDMT